MLRRLLVPIFICTLAPSVLFAREYFFPLDKTFDRHFENAAVVVAGALTEIAPNGATGIVKPEKVLKGSALPDPLRAPLGAPPAPEGDGAPWKKGEPGVWFFARDTFRVIAFFRANASVAIGLPAQVASLGDRRWGDSKGGLAAAAYAYHETGSPYVYYALTLRNTDEKAVRLELDAGTALEVVWVGKKGEKTVLTRKADQLAHGAGRVKELHPGDSVHLHLGFTRSRRADDLRAVKAYRLIYRTPSLTVETKDEKLLPRSSSR